MKRLFSKAESPGMLVTVDGPNGSGKTSLAAEVVERLADRGHTVHSTAQPSPTRLGTVVRESERDVAGRALACLAAGDRHHQLASEIAPALERDEIVICDRYVESSLVLQRLDGVEVEYILAINEGILRPDLRVRLFADVETLRTRVAQRLKTPARRFERLAEGTERELELYGQADELLTAEYGLPSLAFDTTHTRADELGDRVAHEIDRRRG